MKRILSTLLALCLLFSLAGCGEKTFEQAKAEYEAMTPEQLIEKNIKDKTAITPEEYVNLISTFQYANVEENGISLDYQCPTYEAIKILNGDKTAVKPKTETYINTLLQHESPNVRYYGVGLLSSWLGVIDQDIEPVKQLLKNEKETLVQYQAVESLASYIDEDPDVAEFYIRMAKSDNSDIKRRVAVNLGRESLKDVEGIYEALVGLTKDSDDDVKEAALDYIGGLGREEAIDILAAVLADTEQGDFHGDAAEGLEKMWKGSYPKYEKTNEKAYLAALDYIKNCPAGNDLPDWIAVRTFYFQDKDGFESWKTRAPYYNQAEVIAALAEIIKNPNAPFLSVTGAVDALKSICTKAELEENKAIIDALEGTEYNGTKEEYNKAVSEAQ